MARLLVSVRSAQEALAAVSGGASIIDVKEPSAGTLGCADPSVWSEIRRVVPADIPISVALGEMSDWHSGVKRIPPPEAWCGITFAKMGLAGAGPDWLTRWLRVRSRFEDEAGMSGHPSWVAVVYADWHSANSPDPDQILDASLDDPRCVGVLVDSWHKGPRPTVDLVGEWQVRTRRVRNSGKFLAWAGGIGIAEIEHLATAGISPDIIAVRGSACLDGNRLGPIDADRVSRLKDAAAGV